MEHSVSPRQARPYRLGDLTLSGPAAVWLLNGALALGAVAVFVSRLTHVGPAGDVGAIPWWLLAAMFAATEVLVVHLRLGREALTISMS